MRLLKRRRRSRLVGHQNKSILAHLPGNLVQLSIERVVSFLGAVQLIAQLTLHVLYQIVHVLARTGIVACLARLAKSCIWSFHLFFGHQSISVCVRDCQCSCKRRQ